MAKITESLFDLNKTIIGTYLKSYEYPYQILNDLEYLIIKIGKTLNKDEFKEIKENVWISNRAVISPSAEINPPCIIDDMAEIRHSAFIRGSAIIGKKAVIGNSVEIKNSIIFDEAEIPHFNYVGDSIIGYKAHLSGGVITSNIKIDKSPIIIKFKGEEFNTDRIKVGALVGDYAEVGCHSVLNAGVVIARYSRIYPLSSVRGFIPEKMIYKDKDTLVPIA